MTIVQHTVRTPAGAPIKNAYAVVALIGPGLLDGGVQIISEDKALTNSTGLAQFDLTPNALIFPSPSYYVWTNPDGSTLEFQVVATGGVVQLGDAADAPLVSATASMLVTKGDKGDQGTAGPRGLPGTGLTVAGKTTFTATLSVNTTTLAANKINQVDDTVQDVTAALPSTSTPGDWIIVEKIGGSAAAHGNKVAVTGNMRGVPATTINLSMYRQVDMYLADDTTSGVWWPQVNRMVLGTMDNRYAQLFPTAPTRTNINATATVVPAPVGTANGDYWYRMTAATCPLHIPGPGIVDANGAAALVTLTFWMDQDGTGGRDFSIATGSGFPTVTWFGGKPSFASAGANARGLFYLVSLDGGTTYLGFAGGGSGGIGTLTRVPRTSAYSAQLNDLVVADTTGGTFATQLPAANAGKGRIVFRWDAGTAAPTITLTGSDKLNNSSTSGPLTPTALGRTYQLESDGTSIWTVTSAFIPTSELVLQSLAQAKGDLIVASGAGAFTRLAPPGAVRIPQIDASGNWSYIVTPTGGAAAGALLNRLSWVNNGAQTDATTTNTTVHDFATDAVTAAWSGAPSGTAGSTSFDIPFTNATTAFVVKVRCAPFGSSSSTNVKLALADVNASGATITNTTQTVRTGTNVDPSRVYEVVVTGRTLGASENIRLQWGLGGSGTAHMQMGTTLGPLSIEVYAA